MKKYLYTGVFFSNGKHMTYDFNRDVGAIFPPGVTISDKQSVIVYSTFISNSLAYLGCYFKYNNLTFKTQMDSDNPLHITLYTADGVQPVESGKHLKESLASKTDKPSDILGYSRTTNLIRLDGEWSGFHIG